jgi:hypothetical protein
MCGSRMSGKHVVVMLKYLDSQGIETCSVVLVI